MTEMRLRPQLDDTVATDNVGNNNEVDSAGYDPDDFDDFGEPINQGDLSEPNNNNIIQIQASDSDNDDDGEGHGGHINVDDTADLGDFLPEEEQEDESQHDDSQQQQPHQGTYIFIGDVTVSLTINHHHHPP
ncbi:unnamed protein product [Ambrosiozyma monospora]|uniref:Unnamed protein product n=1 Tax=Ambrosiozyma monospora TaxID=43982 RepID=A0ACB5SU57_AMBMO|nr:unnamed protein product [Ambrosiozyma monospora]